MNKNKKMMLSLLLCCSALLSGCIHPDKPPNTDTTAETQPAMPNIHYHQSAVYSYKTDVDESVLCTSLSAPYLILANKQHPIGENYKPQAVVTLTCPVTKEEQLDSRAAAALYEMLDEMQSFGITDIFVTSAYRSYARQQYLFNHYKEIEKASITDEARAYFSASYIKTNYTDKGLTGLNDADAEKVVLSYSARPGTSEHQTGLCVDFITDSMGGKLTTQFENEPAFAWLRDNAYKFGFILRYPKGKENITGYTYEPWHYRFVGREAATDIHFSGLTLEEYLNARG